MGNESENKTEYYIKTKDDKFEKLEIAFIDLGEGCSETIEKIENFGDVLEIKLEPMEVKRLMKSIGIQRISKKRAKKLLMAKGYQRNQATNISEIIYPRTMDKIKIIEKT